MSDAAELRDLGHHAISDADGPMLAEALDALYTISASTMLEDILEAELPALDLARRRALAPGLARSGRLASARVFVEQLAASDDLVAHAVLAPTHGPMDRALVQWLDQHLTDAGRARCLATLGRRRASAGLDWLLTRGASVDPAADPQLAADLSLALCHFDERQAWQAIASLREGIGLEDRRTLNLALIRSGDPARVWETWAGTVERAEEPRWAAQILGALDTAERVDPRWWPIAWTHWREAGADGLAHSALPLVVKLDHPNKLPVAKALVLRGEAPPALVTSLDRAPRPTQLWTEIARTSPRLIDVAAAAEKLAATGNDAHVTIALAALERVWDVASPWNLRRLLEAVRTLPAPAQERLLDKTLHLVERAPEHALGLAELIAFEAAHVAERKRGALPGLDRLETWLHTHPDPALDDALLDALRAADPRDDANRVRAACRLLSARVPAAEAERRVATADAFATASARFADGELGPVRNATLDALRAQAPPAPA